MINSKFDKNCDIPALYNKLNLYDWIRLSRTAEIIQPYLKLLRNNLYYIKHYRNNVTKKLRTENRSLSNVSWLIRMADTHQSTVVSMLPGVVYFPSCWRHLLNLFKIISLFIDMLLFPPSAEEPLVSIDTLWCSSSRRTPPVRSLSVKIRFVLEPRRRRWPLTAVFKGLPALGCLMQNIVFFWPSTILMLTRGLEASLEVLIEVAVDNGGWRWNWRRPASAREGICSWSGAPDCPRLDGRNRSAAWASTAAARTAWRAEPPQSASLSLGSFFETRDICRAREHWAARRWPGWRWRTALCRSGRTWEWWAPGEWRICVRTGRWCTLSSSPGRARSRSRVQRVCAVVTVNHEMPFFLIDGQH